MNDDSTGWDEIYALGIQTAVLAMTDKDLTAEATRMPIAASGWDGRADTDAIRLVFDYRDNPRPEPCMTWFVASWGPLFIPQKRDMMAALTMPLPIAAVIPNAFVFGPIWGPEGPRESLLDGVAKALNFVKYTTELEEDVNCAGLPVMSAASFPALVEVNVAANEAVHQDTLMSIAPGRMVHAFVTPDAGPVRDNYIPPEKSPLCREIGETPDYPLDLEVGHWEPQLLSILAAALNRGLEDPFNTDHRQAIYNGSIDALREAARTHMPSPDHADRAFTWSCDLLDRLIALPTDESGACDYTADAPYAGGAEAPIETFFPGEQVIETIPSTSETFPDYQPKTTPDAVLDYRYSIKQRLDDLPPAELGRLEELLNTLSDLHTERDANPGKFQEGNMILGAAAREYVPSDAELLISEVGERIRQVMTSTHPDQLMTFVQQHADLPDEVVYGAITYWHMDVMGSGRFTYASEPIDIRLPLSIYG